MLNLLIENRATRSLDKGPPDIDQIELVSNEAEIDRTIPATARTTNKSSIIPIEDSDSEAESIPDLSNERGVRFHLKKKSK